MTMLPSVRRGESPALTEEFMANIKQQKKRILVAERQRMENIRYRSSIKTAFRRVVEAVQSGDAAAVDAAHKTYAALIDRAASKHALHANTASRKKARITRVIARGPLVEETKKRRVTRKTVIKAAPKADAAEAEVAEAVVDEDVVEAIVEEAVVEAIVDEAVVEAIADEAVVEAPKKKPAAKKPAAKKTAAKKPAKDAPDAPTDES